MINQIKKLPDAEFEIMKTIWSMSEPVTSSQIAEKMSDHNWKLPTLISFLKRLIERRKQVRSVSIIRWYPNRIILNLKQKISLARSITTHFQALLQIYTKLIS